MRHFRNFLVLTCLLGAFANPIRAQKPSDADLKYFKDLDYALWTAWDSLSPSKVAKFYAKDPANLYFDIAPLKFQGWAQYAQIAGKNLASAPCCAKWSPNGDDFVLVKSGDLAVTALTMNVRFPGPGGTVKTLAVRATDVWQKQGDNWLVVHEHVSVPGGEMQAPSAKAGN